MLKLISNLTYFFTSLILIFCLSQTPTLAVENSNTITQEQLQEGEDIARQALEATQKGDFAHLGVYRYHYRSPGWSKSHRKPWFQRT